MRKILSLFLALVIVCLMLTGCSEEFIDKFREDIKQYDDVVLSRERGEIELDFYIICEDATTDRSKEDVERYINLYLNDLYKTTLDIHYLSAAEYEAKALADAAVSGADRADIVLIVGKDMFDKFYNANLLADITSFYSTKQFGLLNTLIAAPLLQSATVSVDAVDQYGTSYTSNRFYTVPNNHVIGEYEYVIINKQVARYYNYSNAELNKVITDDDIAALQAVIGEENVKKVSGIYTDKANYQAGTYPGDATEYHVNVAKYPTADVNEAFLSGFGIVRHELDTRHVEAEANISLEAKNAYNDHYLRCMEVVYSLSEDVTLRNYLQYGYKGTNYTVDENGVITSYTEGAGVYKMNILYTGNLFKAYYTTDENVGWNEETYKNGVEQNKDAVVPTVPAE